jgi:hypothetical protein
MSKLKYIYKNKIENKLVNTVELYNITNEIKVNYYGKIKLAKNT